MNSFARSAILQRQRKHRTFVLPVTNLSGRKRHLVARFVYLRKAAKKSRMAAANITPLNQSAHSTSKTGGEISPLSAVDAESGKTSSLEAFEVRLREQQIEKRQLFDKLKKVLRVSKDRAQQKKLDTNSSAMNTERNPNSSASPHTNSIDSHPLSSPHIGAVKQHPTNQSLPATNQSSPSKAVPHRYRPLSTTSNSRWQEHGRTNRNEHHHRFVDDISRSHSSSTTNDSRPHSNVRVHFDAKTSSHSMNDGIERHTYMMQGTHRQHNSVHHHHHHHHPSPTRFPLSNSSTPHSTPTKLTRPNIAYTRQPPPFSRNTHGDIRRDHTRQRGSR